MQSLLRSVTYRISVFICLLAVTVASISLPLFINPQKVKADVGVAQWGDNGIVIGANNDFGTSDSIPDGSGGAFVTWSARRDSYPFYDFVYVQHVNASGTQLWNGGSQLAITTSTAISPRIISDGSGGMIITWWGGPDPDTHIYVQRLDSSGTEQWTSGGVPLTSTGSQNFPQIITDGYGGAIIEWKETKNGDGDIYAQRITHSGSISWVADGVPIASGTGNQGAPISSANDSYIASDVAGGMIVVYNDDISGNSNEHLQRVDGSGNLQWGAGGVVINAVSYEQQNEAIAVDDSANTFVTWADSSSGNFEAYIAKYNSSGSPVWGPTIFSSANGQHSYGANISLDTGTGIFLAWTDAFGGDTWGQHINSSGSELWTAGGVRMTTNHPNGLSNIISDGAGGIIVLSGSYFNTPKAQRVDSSGAILWGPSGSDIFTQTIHRTSMPLVSDDAGGGIVFTGDELTNNELGQKFDPGVGGGGGGGTIGSSVVLPGSSDDSGYFSKVVFKPDGFPLIYYYGISATGGADFGYMIGCNDLDCTSYTTTRIGADATPVGAWGLLYFKSNGLPSYLTRDTALQGTLSRLDCSNADCTGYSFTSSVFPKTGGYYGSVTGAVRPNGVPFMAMDGAGMGHTLEMFTCSNENCTSGTRRNLDTSGNTGDNPYVAVLPDNRPVISYHDRALHALKLYVCANVACTSGTIRVLDQVGSSGVGTNSAMVIRNDGTPGIAYTAPSGGLRFYSCNDADCTSGSVISTHDNDGNITGNPGGADTIQLAIDGSGNPVILSQTARGRSGQNVSIYKCYDTNCSEGRFRTLALAPGVSKGSYASIALRADGGYVIPFKNTVTNDAELYDALPTGTSSIASLDSALEVKQISRQDPLNILTDSISNPQSQNFSTAVVDVRVGLSTGEPIADTVVTFNENGNMNWSSVSGDSDTLAGKAVIAHLGTAPGAATEHTLYVPRLAGSSGVHICPGATTMGEVTLTCGSGYDLNANSANVRLITYNSQQYWKISGLTGTGGLSITAAFNVIDLLSRLKDSTPSNHTISFGTINGVQDPGNSIVITFDPAQGWDISPITITDIQLLDSGVPVTLAPTPDVNTWGVTINPGTGQITFTPPTSGTGYIPPGDQIIVNIGTNVPGGSNQIINPPAGGADSVGVIINGSSGNETGFSSIAIISEDTTNVTGYIETFVTFDIDTASTNSNCDAAGGASPCNSHSGTNDGAGYVVDMGEMSTSTVNVSGNTVLHQDGASGDINSIWLDLSTNANNGAAVQVFSLNNALLGPGGSTIPSVGSGEVEILPGSSLYGIQNRQSDRKSTVSGLVNIDSDCSADSGDTFFCSIGGTAGRTLFDTNASPVDSARVQFRLGATPNSQNPTGTYTDEVTFLATPTF